MDLQGRKWQKVQGVGAGQVGEQRVVEGVDYVELQLHLPGFMVRDGNRLDERNVEAIVRASPSSIALEIATEELEVHWRTRNAVCRPQRACIVWSRKRIGGWARCGRVAGRPCALIDAIGTDQQRT